ncbi:MAG: chromate efflux transporter [Nitrospirota bacterium]
MSGPIADNAPRVSLSELGALFLKLGTIGFGGPAAHIAMMEDEVVRRRGWLTREQFLDYLGATNLIPGPNSTEMAIHIGHARAGWPGLLVAGCAFILPATLIVAALAWAYVRFGALPQVAGVLYGVKPVVIAVVIQALWGLGRSAVTSYRLAALGLASATAILLGVHELAVLAAAAAAGAMLARPPDAGGGTWKAAALATTAGVFPVSTAALAAGSTAGPAAVSLTSLFGAFVKIGAVLFGSGYVLLAFLRADFVERFGWLTEQQLLDAVAVGQVTPGPLFTTATFVGYLVAGWPGAVLATIGIFLPAFVFVALSGPLVPRIRRSPSAGVALDGVIVASLALMAIVTWQLGLAAVTDATTAILAIASALLLMRFRVNSAWLVAGGAVIGLLIPL